MIRKNRETGTAKLAGTKDQRVTIHNVTWEQYRTIRKALGEDHPSLRMTFLDGILEILITGDHHENVKSCFARLLELYALERGIEIYAKGAPTLGRKKKRTGFEPDESYAMGAPKKTPDFALEVVITSGGIKKLRAYRRLGVREVIFWKKGAFQLYRLEKRKYVRQERSIFFPDLDLGYLASVIATMLDPTRSHLAILREFRERLRG